MAATHCGHPVDAINQLHQFATTVTPLLQQLAATAGSVSGTEVGY